MNTMAILVALTALGVESGYEPATDGQLEYIVQIEPQMVPQLAKGQDITSELPRGLKVRHFRVTIGTGKLPKQSVDGRSTRNRLPTDGQAAAAEPPGVETQDVRVGYQPLAKGDGEYVIEITPTGLTDLDQHDLTGDIPAKLAISRVRISTQPGSAPEETTLVAAASSDPAPRLAAAGQPTLAAGQPTPAKAQPTPAAGQPRPAAGPAFPPGTAPLPSGPPIISPGPPAADNDAPPLEILTPQEQAELEHPDLGPAFQFPVDPAAEPITSKPIARQPAADSAPKLANPDPALPADKSTRPGKFGDGLSGTNRTPPAKLSADPQSVPLAGKNVTYSEQEPTDERATEHQTQKPSQDGKKAAGGWKEAAKSELRAGEEELAKVEERWPWFTLAVTLMLFLSIGGNLYMGWVAWDARNRSRSLLERFRAGELTLN